MTFDWKEYLRLAEYLPNNLREDCFAKEAALRSSVSRAYYAAFCLARRYARNNNGYVMFAYTKNVHIDLCNHFRHKGRAAIANHLETLKMLRNNCDYDDVVENIDNVLKQSLKLAKGVIRQLA